ncbi:synaptotagmin-like protein 2 [Notolabrus celidotus]|uniref:synaptotagmin-like protein 2 n=1 Tax=Notolabrus celidotus TaxID=1203425 RepID=UPI00148F4972|nr:synaptotagmin-like protein 2 [Notolabrus celidotus]
MIDLSYLTEEEQQSILAVLRRDAELKKAEEERVQKLQRKVNNKDRLKHMTGEWFYETKQLRHQERIHGSDIIRASMRHTHKPMTLMEISSRVVPEKPSFVRSENKEVFVPPILRGVLQEPSIELSNESDRSENKSPSPTPENEPSLVLQSPTKERKNPFDSEVMESLIAEELDGEVNEAMTQNEGPLSSCDDCSSQIDDPSGERQATSAAPRSILKHLSPSSSSACLFPRLDQQSPVSLDCLSETWIDRKQVRFSSMVIRSGLDLQDGSELGEHSLLDVDFAIASEDEHNSDRSATDQSNGGTHGASLRSQVNLLEEELGYQNEAIILTRDVVSGLCYLEFVSPAESGLSCAEQESDKPVPLEPGPEEDLESTIDLSVQSSDITADANSDSTSSQPAQRLLEKREEDEQTQKEEVHISEQQEPDNNHLISQDVEATTNENNEGVEQEAKVSELSAVRTLQLTVMQNTPFEESVTPVDTDIQHPERLSNLKAFWERDNSAPKIVFAREEAGNKDINKTGIEAAFDPKTNLDEESTNNSLSPQMENTANTSQEECSSPQTDCSLVVLSEEDGTYRANPVLIFEETEDALTSSTREPDTSETQENMTIPAHPSSPLNSPKHEEATPDPTPQEDRRARISDLKNFWEKEVIKSREIAANASNRLSLRGKVFSPQSDQRSISFSKEKFEAEGPTSPTKNNSNTALKSLNVSDKGFVSQSPHRSPLKSPGDVPPICLQSREEADIEAPKGPVSPKKSKIPRPKDQDEETRRSPSKTCHPRVLPRDTSSPHRPNLEGSPLKTFPIDIDPKTKKSEEHQEKPTPMPRQRKSPSHEAKQLTETQPCLDTIISNVNTQQSSSKSPSPQHKKTPEKKLRTLTRLARSIIPQDYQHYLGPHEKAHVPPFTEESEVLQSPQKAPKNSKGNSWDSPKKSSCTVQNKDGDFSQDIMTRACSLPRPSSGSCDEIPSIMVTSVKEFSPKRKSPFKSLETLTSNKGKENSLDISRKQTNQSGEDVSSLPSSSDLKHLKSFGSEPVLQQDETDSDSPFETYLGLRRNTGSSTSNLSLSSGLASMSSVSGSISSIYPADFGDIEVQGSVQFAVNYIQKLGEFHIFVVHCRDLAVADTKKNRSDPYVKCYLLPDKTKLGKRKTAVKKKTLSPDFNEILRFKVPMEMLKTQNLNISVWHNDTFGRNSFLGDVDLDLSEWDFSNTHINDYALNSRVSAQTSSPSPSQLTDSRGQIRVALRFLLQTSHSQGTSKMETSEVQIWVKDCKNLPAVRGVVIDPFVKCTVLPDTSRKSRQKTRVVKRSANPMFNHTMVYDGFRAEDLKEACAEITVWDHDRLNNHYIGGVRLGQGTGKSYGVDVVWMDSTPDEAHLWQRMLQSEGEWVEDILPLRMLVMAKSTSK